MKQNHHLVLSIKPLKTLTPIELPILPQFMTDEEMKPYLGDFIPISKELYEELYDKIEKAHVDGLTDGNRIFLIGTSVNEDEYRIWEFSEPKP